MPITKGQGNPNWSTEETLLALDLLLKHAPAIPDKNHPEVKRLSDLLRTLPIHPSESRNDRFRNPAGVSMKLQNLNACKTGRGLSTSKVDRAVWDNFGTEPESVRKIAVAIEDGAYLLQETTKPTTRARYSPRFIKYENGHEGIEKKC
jgi:5-methylcytosine-specific restriction protein A